MNKNQDTTTTNTNQPSQFTERLISIALVILSIAIGYEQGAKHATQAYAQAHRITEARQIIDAEQAGCTTDTDCLEKFGPEPVN